MIENIDSNQTQFAQQSPVMGNVTTYAPDPSEVEVKPKKSSSKMVLIGVIGVFLLIVFILLMVLIRSMSSKKDLITNNNGDVIVREQGEISPMLNEVYILSEDLELADPSLDTIPFPPVDMELRLDEKKRRK